MGAVTGGGGGGGASAVLDHKVTLQSADILALGTTPFTLVPAVTGKIIVPLALLGSLHFGTVDYTESGNWRLFLGPAYATSGWGAVTALATIIGVLKTTAVYYDIGSNFPGITADITENLSALQSQPFRTDESAAVTGGDGTLDLTTLYYLLTP